MNRRKSSIVEPPLDIMIFSETLLRENNLHVHIQE
jgi:hypothetical protein